MKNQKSYFNSSLRGSLAIEELTEIRNYGELIFQFIRRDLISRYKRSFLGVAWTMLNPLGSMLVLTLVFSNLFQSVKGYPAYVLVGLLAWTFFAQCTSAILNQNLWGGSLLQKIYIPRTIFSISSVGTGIINLLISLIPMIIIILIIGIKIKLSILILPIAIIQLAAFSLGIGLIFSTLAIYFPDVADMYQVALTAWMYLTPIIYPVEIIPQNLRPWLLNLNPMYYLVEVFRQPIYDGLIPSINIFLTGSLISGATLIIGWLLFTWKANELTYRT